MDITLYKKASLFSMLFFVAGICVHAQDHFLSLDDTTVIKAEEAPMSAPPIMAKKWNQLHTKYFNLNLGLALILDHNIVSQDNNNIEQVGKVNPGTEFRGERIVLSGTLNIAKYPWRYMISANFNGLDAPPGKKTFEFIDYNVEIPLGKTAGWITFGKQKEGVGHEYVAPGTQLMFMERGSGVPMFVRQRNIGIRYSNSILQQRATYTIGLFNNYWETGKSFAANGSQVTARITALPEYTSDRDLLHLGFGYRYSDATDGKLSYRAKPEANTAPAFINTGSISASASNTIMLEAIKVNGPVSFIGEYLNAFVNATGSASASFNYWQLGGSWFITGENRRYNKQNGNLGKLIPKKNFHFGKAGGTGAFELGARFTHSNLSSGDITGGEFNRFTGAFSWYPNTSFRFSINYGHGILYNGLPTGSANFWQFRAQFEL